MAVRSMACMGGSLSAGFGASLSVRNFVRFFAVSVWQHEIWLLLVPDRRIIAVSEVVRLGASVAVLSDTHLGGSLSLRSFSRSGSSLSEWSIPHFGSHLGSSLSPQTFPHLELSSVCQDFHWPFEGVSMTVLASSVLLCPCEVHHVWGRRFLWRKKCFSARLFHCVLSLIWGASVSVVILASRSVAFGA